MDGSKVFTGGYSGISHNIAFRAAPPGCFLRAYSAGSQGDEQIAGFCVRQEIKRHYWKNSCGPIHG